MKCPKCSGRFAKVVYQGIHVDRCDSCNGIWFDVLELKDLLKKKGSEAIDVGTPQNFEKTNPIVDVWCPKCNQRMIKMVDAKQNHVWFESCGQCFGIFLDATEFSDLKEKSFKDLVRSMAAVERKA
jgi:Zn-finger nucleic acid-binding protein